MHTIRHLGRYFFFRAWVLHMQFFIAILLLGFHPRIERWKRVNSAQRREMSVHEESTDDFLR